MTLIPSAQAETMEKLFEYSLEELIQLEVVEVSAQRRVEQQQEVPIAISSINRRTLELFNAQKSLDLQQMVPGLTFTQSLSSSAIFLRGVGSSYSAAGGESPITLYVDDVYYGSTASAFFPLYDVAYIDVLKGPQGTLFGRNATGGVINIRTIGPTPDDFAQISARVGNYDLFQAQGHFSGQLTSSWRGQLSTLHSQHNGYGHNTVTGSPTYFNETQAVRGKLEGSYDSSKIRLSAHWSEEEDMNGVALSYFPESVNRFTGTALYSGLYNTTGDTENRNLNNQKGLNLRVEYELDWARLTSISAYHETGLDLVQDGDRTPLPTLLRQLKTEANTKLQEIHLLAPDHSRLNWIVGLFYMDEESAYLSPGTSLTNPQVTTLFDTQQETQSFALFAQATWPLSDTTQLTLGFRETRDRREARHYQQQIQTEGSVLEVSEQAADNWSELTWRFALDHQLSDNHMAYASYNRGFKAGLFNTAPFNSTPVKPENLDAYEVGLKSAFLNHRLTLNSALYYYKYKDMQVQSNVSNDVATFNILQNAAQATIKGLEMEFQYALSQSCLVQGGYAWVEGQYDEIFGVSFAVPNEDQGNSRISLDMTNLALMRTPKHSLNLALLYRMESQFGSFDITGALSHNSEYYFEAAHITNQEPLTLVNAAVTWTSLNENWQVKLWGSNLTNEIRYLNANAIPPGDIYSPAAPRTFGLELARHF